MIAFPVVAIMTDRLRLPHPQEMAERLPKGSVIILRHYDAPDRRQLGRDLRVLTRRRGLFLLIAGADWRLAESVGADGLHLPEGLARHGVLAPLLGWCRNRRRILSIAAHSPAAVARAAALRADWAVLSPVFATGSHSDAPSLGPVKLRQWTRQAGLPVIALGGINARTLPQLHRSGIAGAAFGSPVKSSCFRTIKEGTLRNQTSSMTLFTE